MNNSGKRIPFLSTSINFNNKLNNLLNKQIDVIFSTQNSNNFLKWHTIKRGGNKTERYRQ